MKIIVVGRGRVGGGLAGLWEKAGHWVTGLGRDGGDAAGADVLVVAVPGIGGRRCAGAGVGAGRTGDHRRLQPLRTAGRLLPLAVPPDEIDRRRTDREVVLDDFAAISDQIQAQRVRPRGGRRLGQASEIGGAMAYLGSDLTSYGTGTALVVDDGPTPVI
ncbi:dinucleotide-binding protein [Streptomyces sp. NPDC094048]|uniref:dinucleotide-binding protein n=1 Tax=Streptomyces sp. NPDC094048 TaxID=3155207 RepID=UPI0033174821